MAKQNDLVSEAQKKGITLTETDDGWHGLYIHAGQEYTLDGDTVEGVSDDMDALVEILSQDDTYTVDYNDDLERYLVSAIGFDEPFSDANLAKAFAQAKAGVMERMRKEEEERKKREAPAKAKPAPAAKKPAAAKANGDQPTPVSDVGSAQPSPEMLTAIENAVAAFSAALFAIAGLQGQYGIAQPAPQSYTEPEIATPEPPKRRRGLSKA